MEKEEYDDMYFVGLRSARRRQRQVYEDRDKHLLKLHREWKIIHPRIRAVEWVPLEHPYQRGWERIFVMREDLKRDRKASFYQKILDKINTRQWSSRKDFKRKKKVRGRKRDVLGEQYLRDVSKSEFWSSRFTDEERACFEMRIKPIGKQDYIEYRFAEPWRFVLKVQANMVTHIHLQNTEMDSRYAFIESFLRYDNNDRRLSKLLRGHWGYKWEKDDLSLRSHPFHNRSFAEVLSEHWPADTDRNDKILLIREDFSFNNPYLVLYLAQVTDANSSCHEKSYLYVLA